MHSTREDGKAGNEKRHKKGLEEGLVHEPIVASVRHTVEEQTIAGSDKFTLNSWQEPG